MLDVMVLMVQNHVLINVLQVTILQNDQLLVLLVLLVLIQVEFERVFVVIVR